MHYCELSSVSDTFGSVVYKPIVTQCVKPDLMTHAGIICRKV